MRRKALVACLMFALLLTGCTGRRWTRTESLRPLGLVSGECMESYGRWLDDHPVMKGTTYCAMFVGVAVLVAGAVVGAAYLHSQESNNQDWRDPN